MVIFHGLGVLSRLRCRLPSPPDRPGREPSPVSRHGLRAPLLAVGAVAVLGAGWLGVVGPAMDAATAAPASSGAGTGYWHTSGNQILDSDGNPVRIAGVNWYGFETPDEIAHGLWAQDYHTIIGDIKNLGYNTIRIPFSNQMVETPIVPQNVSFYNTGPINTDLKGLKSLQILDEIIAYAGQEGLAPGRRRHVRGRGLRRSCGSPLAVSVRSGTGRRRCGSHPG